MSEYIILDEISKSYGKFQVLKDVSATLEQGHIHGVIGRNGSGKTQLFKVIAGYVQPDHGTAAIGGKIVGRDISHPESMGLMIESPGFLPEYTGLFNLQLLAAINTKLGKLELLQVLRDVGLEEAAMKKAGRYSLGMRQRLGIAQAIMGNPSLLILDEPFNGLDKTGVLEIRKLLENLCAAGTTILLSSHYAEDIEALCDTVHEMDAGVITRIR